jgi:hypothetical protein
VYSPENDEVIGVLMSELAGYVKPFLRVTSVPQASDLLPYLRKTNAYVGIEFPDGYMVSVDKLS